MTLIAENERNYSGIWDIQGEHGQSKTVPCDCPDLSNSNFPQGTFYFTACRLGLNEYSPECCLGWDFFLKYILGRGLLFFSPPSNSCRHSLSLMLLASEQLHWSELGFKRLPQGHHSGVCWGSGECCSFIFHTSTSPRLSVLKSYIASKKNNSFLSPTSPVCVCVFVRARAHTAVSLLSLFSHTLSYCLPCVSHFSLLDNGSGWQPHLKSRDERHHLQVGVCAPCVCLSLALSHARTHAPWQCIQQQTMTAISALI